MLFKCVCTYNIQIELERRISGTGLEVFLRLVFTIYFYDNVKLRIEISYLWINWLLNCNPRFLFTATQQVFYDNILSTFFFHKYKQCEIDKVITVFIVLFRCQCWYIYLMCLVEEFHLKPLTVTWHFLLY